MHLHATVTAYSYTPKQCEAEGASAQRGCVEAGEERVLQWVESFIDLRRSLCMRLAAEHALETGGRGGCGEVLLGHLSELGEAVLVVLPPGWGLG